MTTEYIKLIRKLDEFIRKYYRNQIVRGLLLALLVYGAYYLLIVLFEYYGRFSVTARTILFYVSVGLYGVIAIFYLLLPLLHFFRIGKIINHKQAAEIISRHFAEVEDKLLNILELASISHKDKASDALLMASIDQKIGTLRLFSFPLAIDTRRNWRYVKYLAVLLVLFLSVYIFWPDMLTQSTFRIINYQTHFEEPAPFSFELLNDSMEVKKGGDFELRVKVSGKYVPNTVSIHYGGNDFVMKKESNTVFVYDFKTINNSLSVRFSSEDYYSRPYRLKVLPSPLIMDFRVVLSPPAYTGEKSVTLENVGDLTVPAGTMVEWVFETKDIDSLGMSIDSFPVVSLLPEAELCRYKRRVLGSFNYRVSARNSYFYEQDLLSYSVKVIPDLRPTIELVSFQDSLTPSAYYFNGMISDDYGFRKLTFNYRVGEDGKLKQIGIPISWNVVTQEFYYAFDFSDLKMKSNQSVSYYFEVWDNDAVNGSKSTRSSEYHFKVPSLQELSEMERESGKAIEEKMAASQELISELQRDIKNLQKNLIDKEMSSWERTNALNNIVEKQNELERMLEEIKEENSEKNQQVNSFTEENKELLEKQKLLEEMLENVLSDELKALIDEINKLSEEFNKERMNQLTEELDYNYEDLSKHLDRNMEMLKQYEVEKRMDNVMEELDLLGGEQEDISEITEDRNSDKDNLERVQGDHKERFDKLQEEYDAVQEKNKELERPFEMDSFDEQMQDIEQEMEQVEEDLSNNHRRKAAKGQKSTSQKMKQLAEDMSAMMQANMMEQNAQNMEELRQLLENLLTFSFDQEALMEKLKRTNKRDPIYVDHVNAQKKLGDNFEMINDSLLILAGKIPELNTFVNKELLSLNKNLRLVLTDLEDRRTYHVSRRQQDIMTSANDLALMLAESLEQMQNMSSSSSSGSKGGKDKKDAMGEMKQQQQSIKEQLERMLQQMQNGQMDPKSMNQQLAKMLAEQEVFQKMLRDLQNQSGVGEETTKLLEEINQMVEETQRDLINRTITPETINRQKNIMTRLLEAENAENERELDKKRESNEAKNKKISNPEEFFKYKGDKDMFKESLQDKPLKLENFYQRKYKDYLLKLKSD